MNELERLHGVRVGACICGSFCTFDKVFAQLQRLVELGCDVTAIMSENSAALDTRFGTAQSHIERLRMITGKEVLRGIVAAEPVGPKRMFDVLLVAPCTGNTLAKLALGIVDSTVCMAVKSHLRNCRPVVLAVSTNDALAGASKNIGTLRNYKNYYFVPVYQDDSVNKPFSMLSDVTLIPQALVAALDGRQLQPMLV